MSTEKKYLDYEAVKKTVSVVDVLTEHYGLADTLVTIAEGRAYSCACPICKSERGYPFRITMDSDTSAWYCLGECDSGGNVLDLVAKLEETDIHEAAFLLHEWFDLKSPATNGKKKTTKEGKGYLRDIDKELKKLLTEGDDDATIRFVKEKVLESYRNGIDVGKSTKKTTKQKPAQMAS